MYRPLPVPGRAWYAARPPAKFKLAWAPEFAEIAASGEFGYTAGPWQLRPDDAPADAPPASGHFFSIWQRGVDGRFYNVLDHGIEHEVVDVDVPLRARGANAAQTGATRGALSTATAAARQQSLLFVDRELARALTTSEGVARWRELLADDVLSLRDASLPLVGKTKAPPPSVLPAMDLAFIRLSAAGDLAATSGWGGDEKAPKVYVRVWRWDGQGWRIAVDVLTG
jgi:ketosteroid isomerase-like protein